MYGMQPLSRAELDLVERCDECGEYHNGPAMAMVQACHPDAGLGLVYERATGLLHVYCVKCKQGIALVAVAETVPGELAVVH